jgi:multiple sugar transport system permease protein
MVWMISASLMKPGEAMTYPPKLFPDEVTFEHYRSVFTTLNMRRYLLNSALIAFTATAVSLVVNSMAGYAFAKLRFRGRDGAFRVLGAGLVIPAQVAMLPLFLLMKQLGLVNTYWGVMIPVFASIFGIFLIRQYATAIPDDLLDAARVDGASELRIYRSIVLPVIAPILATLAIWTFLTTWNDFMWPLIVLSDEAKYTLPVALANLSGEHVQDTELMMAGSVVTVVPVLLAFLALQRYYMRGIMAGSVKG